MTCLAFTAIDAGAAAVIEDEVGKSSDPIGLSISYRSWDAEWELPYNIEADVGEETVSSIAVSYGLSNTTYIQAIYTSGSGWDASGLPAFEGGGEEIERSELQLLIGSVNADPATPLNSMSFVFGYHMIESTSPGSIWFPDTRTTRPYMLETTAHGVDIGLGFSREAIPHVGLFLSGAVGVYWIETEATTRPDVNYDDITAGYNLEAGVVGQYGIASAKLGYRYWTIVGAFDPTGSEPAIEGEDDRLSGVFFELGVAL